MSKREDQAGDALKIVNYILSMKLKSDKKLDYLKIFLNDWEVK